MQATDKLAQEWRDALIESVEPYVGSPIYFSGGTDSATLLAAQLELGGCPSLYSFRLGPNDSVDTAVARRIADAFDLYFTCVEIDQSLKTLEANVRWIIETLGESGKTVVQCAHPIMYMAKAVQDDGYTEAMLGTGGIVLDGRKVAEYNRYEPESAVREFREHKMRDKDRRGCGTWAMHEIARRVGVETAEPYSDEPVRSLGLSISYDEMNRPKQKGIALRAFPDFWSRGYYRTNTPMQVGGGIRGWHDRLLDSDLNSIGAKSVVGIYNAIKRGDI